MRSQTMDTYASKLSKNVIFVKHFEPIDCSNTLGQMVLEITYTDGDKDVLTTKSTMGNVRASFDFENEDQFYQFVKFLQDNNIPRK